VIDRFIPCRHISSRVIVEGALSDPALPDREWRAFMGIPFNLIEMATPPLPGTLWRGNLYRIDRPAPNLAAPPFGDEFSCWAPTFTSPPAFHRPHHFGLIQFVKE